MARYLILGCSGAGKSTLATRLAADEGLAHLDVDVVAWEAEMPPRRRAIADSAAEILAFLDANERWVVEGSYADLAAVALPRCDRLLFLDPGVDACVANARSRPWEPHKYPSPEAQDANLAMLVDWIRAYPTGDDTYSLAAHRALFEAFDGPKTRLADRDAIARYRR